MGISVQSYSRLACVITGVLLTVACAQQPQRAAQSFETAARVRVAAANMQDAVVVDCQLPGSLRKLGGTRTYLTPGKLVRLPAVDCRSVGGDYEVADLAGGTLSLARWMPLAEQGDPEAQYYVARIYANGMSGVTADYAKAADWYQRASGQNYKPATMELAYLYEQGMGVQQDRMRALNMQRSASGLGEDLDYSSKIATAQADAAQQVATISEQLEESNASLQDMRGQLAAMQGKLASSHSEQTRAEDAVLDLRKQLVAASANAVAGSGDPAKVKQLESALATKEQALAASQSRVATLEHDLNSGQAQLAANLASSQASSAELARLLASSQAETKSLRSQSAQTEQRLIGSQEELRQLRASYREGVDQLAAQGDELEKLRRSADGGAGIVAAKQRELDRQSLRVKALETELVEAKRTQAGATASTSGAIKAAQDKIAAADAASKAANDKLAAANAASKAANDKLVAANTSNNAANAKAAAAEAKAAEAAARAAASEAKLAAANTQNVGMRASVASLQARLDEQTKQLQSQRTELASLQGKGQVDRAALVQSLQEKLQKNSMELQEKQRRLASLESETGVLRTQYKQLQDEAAADHTMRTSDVQGLRNANNMLQQRLNENQNELDRLRTESSKARYDLVQQKEQLQAALSAGQQKEREVTRLNLMIQESREVLQAKERLIASLQKDISEPLPNATFANNIQMRSATQPRKLDPEAAKLLSLAQVSERDSGRRYHALVIGNSNYAFMAPLATPLNDARDVADVLRNGYGFEVETLTDATADKILVKLYELSETLTENDNLLIYYAGHGDKGPSESAYWLGVDADKTRKGWIPLDTIRDQIKRMKARHVMVVADACFAGAMTHAKTMSVAREVSEKRFQIQWNRRARMVLTSGQNTPVPDSGGSRDHSLFATYFIQVLRQNVILMSGEMLSYELSGRIVPAARKIGLEEQPTYSTLGDANHDFGEFFFVPVPTKLAALTAR